MGKNAAILIVLVSMALLWGGLSTAHTVGGKLQQRAAENAALLESL